MPLLLIRAATLLDGSGAPPIHDPALLVDGEAGHIRAIGRGADFGPPPHAQVLDLGERCPLPGFVDMHNHLRLSHLEPEPAAQVQDEPVAYVLHAVRHLGLDLASGTTTMRCNGDRDFFDVRLRDAVAAGWSRARGCWSPPAASRRRRAPGAWWPRSWPTAPTASARRSARTPARAPTTSRCSLGARGRGNDLPSGRLEFRDLQQRARRFGHRRHHGGAPADRPPAGSTGRPR